LFSCTPFAIVLRRYCKRDREEVRNRARSAMSAIA